MAVLSPDTNDLATAALADRSFEPCPDRPTPCIKWDQPEAGAPTVVLVGDSTAQSYDPALKLLAEEHGFRYVQAAVGGCPIGHRLLATGEDGELHKQSNFTCFENLPDIYRTVVEIYKPSLVIATSWNETNQHIEDGELLLKGTDAHLAATRDALEESIRYLTADGASWVFIDVLPPGNSVPASRRTNLTPRVARDSSLPKAVRDPTTPCSTTLLGNSGMR